MAKPEGETTRVLRSTMELELDDVNEKLIAAGEKAIDSSTLGKRRAWIRAKDAGKHAKRKAGKTSKKKVAKAKGKRGKIKVVRASRKLPPLTEPRKGTFGAFVYQLPYDMDVNEVVKRARAAGIKGQSAAVYKVRSKYPKDRGTRLNDIASAESLREQDAARRQSQPLALAPVTSRDANLSSARSQFVLLLMRLGLDVADALMQDYRRAHDRLEATISEGLKQH